MATTIEHGPYIERINQARFQAVAAFLSCGVNVVADELFWRPEDLRPFCEYCQGFRVYLFGLSVSDEVGNAREGQRSEGMVGSDASANFRPQGMYRASKVTDTFMLYDAVVNSTDLSPQDCAQVLCQWIQQNPDPASFQSICHQKHKNSNK